MLTFSASTKMAVKDEKRIPKNFRILYLYFSRSACRQKARLFQQPRHGQEFFFSARALFCCRVVRRMQLITQPNLLLLSLFLVTSFEKANFTQLRTGRRCFVVYDPTLQPVDTQRGARFYSYKCICDYSRKSSRTRISESIESFGLWSHKTFDSIPA